MTKQSFILGSLLALSALAGCGDQTARSPSPNHGGEIVPSPDPIEPEPAETAPTEIAPNETAAPGEVGATCGTRGAAPCGDGLFCRHPVEAQCGETDRPGSCQAPPDICTREYRPVCGCDGRTYGNECSAYGAGVSVRARGACPEGGEDASACVRGGCNGELCVEPDTDRQVSICVRRPEHACYAPATCERQADGACGWTQTPELRACLANPPAVDG